MFNKPEMIKAIIKEGKIVGVFLIITCGTTAYLYRDLQAEITRSRENYVELIKDYNKSEKEITRVLSKLESAICDLRRYLEHGCEERRNR